MNKYTLMTALLLFGCAPTYTPIQAFDIEKLSGMEYLDLCKAYYTLNNVTKQLTPTSKAQYEEVLIAKGLPRKDLEKIPRNVLN